MCTRYIYLTITHFIEVFRQFSVSLLDHLAVFELALIAPEQAILNKLRQYKYV